MGDADGSRVSLPESEEERRRFIREHLEPNRRYPERIADTRYTGKWGHYSPDPTKSDWRVRQANRFLTELDRRRELWPVTLGVWIAAIAALVAVLAMPLKDSLLCSVLIWLGVSFCHQLG